MITDFHTHAFPDALAPKAIAALSAASHTVPFTDGTVTGLLSSMKNAGIARSVVLPVATSAHSVPTINRLSATQNGRDDLVWFGAMHPDFEGYADELKRLAVCGVRGIKLHPVYQGVDLDDARYLRILEACAKYDLIVVTHSGKDIGFPGVEHCTTRMAYRALEKVPEATVVLAHMGAWREWDEIEMLSSLPNACIDTSFSLGSITPTADAPYTESETYMLSPEAFVQIVRAFGAKRVLFGTDSPWSEQKTYLDAFRALPLSEEEQRLILSENAERLLAN